MGDKYIIIGLGVFGKTLAQRLMSEGAEVVAVDSNMEFINEIQDDVTYAVCLDSTDEKALLSLGLQDFTAGIVCIGGSFEDSLLTSVLLKNGGIKRVVTRSSNPYHIKILKAVGIDEIITPEKEVAEKLAYNLMHKNLFDIIHIDSNITVAKIKAPEGFYGKTIGKLNLRAKYGINVIAIEGIHQDDDIGQKGKDSIDYSPNAETVITENMRLVVLGDKRSIQQILKV